SDLGRAAERGDAAATIAFELHAGMRHRIPVDREPRARDERGARQADPTSGGQLPELVLPARAPDDLLDAAPQRHRADAQPVGGDRIGRNQVFEPELSRIEPQLLGDLVEVDLEREARLRSAVAAFRSTRRLVREGSCALELVTG